VFMSVNLSSCSDDEDEGDKDYDATLYGEWVENDGNKYVHDYYCFYPDGTGIHGSWESDIDWINEDDDIKWYTVDDKYLYIDGYKYEYSCDGSSLVINIKGKNRYYYAF
ncbi:MAG: hypothetical protein ACI4A8_08905, partial [Muribaculaceae bacterium]